MIATTGRYAQYVGNAITTVFGFPYRFFDSADLEVVQTILGVDTILSLGTHYTVTGADDPAGGSITILAAPVVGTTITIYGATPETQETNYVASDNFPAESHEEALDRLTVLVQQIRLLTSRCIRLPLTSADMGELTVAARAGKFVSFDANGLFQLSDLETAPANGIGVSILAKGSTTNRLLSDRFADFFHARDFSVVGDGVAEDGPALQNALTFLGNNGGGVMRLTGCRIKISQNINIPAGVSLIGPMLYPDPRNPTLLQTFTDSIQINGNFTITLNETSGIQGFKILRYGMAFPQNAAAVAGWTGTAVTVAAQGHAAFISRMAIVGFSRATDMGTSAFTEQTRIEECAFDCLSGVRIVSGTDRVYLEKIECWPTASMGLAGPVDADYQRSGIAFELNASVAGIDAPLILSCFSYGYFTGFKVVSVDGAVFINCVVDYTTTHTPNPIGWDISGDSSITTLDACKSFRQVKAVSFSPNQSLHYLQVLGSSFELCVTADIYCTNGSGTFTNNVFSGRGTNTVSAVNAHGCGGSCRFIINSNTVDWNTNYVLADGGTPGNVCKVGPSIITGNGTNLVIGCVPVAISPVAGILTIPSLEDSFLLAGAGPITSATVAQAQTDRRITVFVTVGITVNHSATIKLLGSTSKAFVNGDNFTLMGMGTYWQETARTLA